MIISFFCKSCTMIASLFLQLHGASQIFGKFHTFLDKESITFFFFRNRNSGFSVCKDTHLTEVCRSYLDSGRAGRWRGVSGSGPSLSYTRSGWWRVFLTPLCGRWWVLGTSGCAGACRDDRGTKTNRWTGRKKGGRLKQKGAEERENFIREKVWGLDGEGKIRDDWRGGESCDTPSKQSCVGPLSKTTLDKFIHVGKMNALVLQNFTFDDFRISHKHKWGLIEGINVAGPVWMHTKLLSSQL